MESALDRVLTRHMGAQDRQTVNRGRCLRVIPQGLRLEELTKLAEVDPTLKIIPLEPHDESSVCRNGLYGIFRVVLKLQEVPEENSDTQAVEMSA
ncbi:MAG TPA: hypothetical protein PJ984_03635 [Candidatus Saccharibacteria bacterium]|jgi:hypothetical protein|nr:hypothetical protein [Patescibacteria group bacterium]HMS31462.1 hypothetical protein [Candidatus Saccharibacteria bacterium]